MGLWDWPLFNALYKRADERLWGWCRPAIYRRKPSDHLSALDNPQNKPIVHNSRPVHLSQRIGVFGALDMWGLDGSACSIKRPANSILAANTHQQILALWSSCKVWNDGMIKVFRRWNLWAFISVFYFLGENEICSVLFSSQRGQQRLHLFMALNYFLGWCI